MRQRTGATRLGDDGLGGDDAAAGDLIQPCHRGQHRGAGTGAGLRAGDPVGVHALCGGDLGDQVAHSRGQGIDLGSESVDLVQQDAGQLAVVGLPVTVQRFSQGGALGPHPPDGQVRDDPGVAFPGDQRLDHRPARVGVQGGGHCGDLDQRPLEQLFQPRPVPGPLVHQVRAQPGELPQPADFRRRHEAGLQQAPLGQLGQPHRVLLVGLGPARHIPDMPGVDQLHRQPGRLQHRPPDPPVVAGALQRDDLDLVAAQMISQLGDRRHGRLHHPHVHLAAARPVLIRHPGAHHPGRLRHVDGGDPLVHPLILLVLDLPRFFHGPGTSLHARPARRGLPGGPGRETKS